MQAGMRVKHFFERNDLPSKWYYGTIDTVVDGKFNVNFDDGKREEGMEQSELVLVRTRKSTKEPAMELIMPSDDSDSDDGEISFVKSVNKMSQPKTEGVLHC